MVPRAGVEPAASPLGGVRSIQLSYRGIAPVHYDRRLYQGVAESNRD